MKAPSANETAFHGFQPATSAYMENYVEMNE